MSAHIPSTDTELPKSPRPLAKWTKRILLWAIPLGLTIGFLVECGNVLLGENLQEVIPGEIYRSAQPAGTRMDRLVKSLGIRTIINLRGCGEPLEWYLNEAKSTHRLNLSQEDLTFSARQLPSIHEVKKLVEVLERSERPVLIHCYRGVDRTGLASASALLLLTDQPLEKAREQLSLRRGHLKVGDTGHIDEFFDLYEKWLTRKNQAHTRQRFRHWAMHEYCPGACRCRLEVLSHDLNKPIQAYENEPFSIRVRAHNESIRPWTFTPDETAGFHVYWNLYDGPDSWVATDRAGLFHRKVSPGESVDVTVQFSPLPAGKYQLVLDMIEENHCAFQHVGGDVLKLTVEVR